MRPELGTLRLAALGCLAMAGLLAAYGAAGDSPVTRGLSGWIERLDRRLRKLFLPPRGGAIVAAQVGSSVVATGL